MAVLNLRWLVAVSAWLPAAVADLGREHPIPGGPVQTPAPNLKEAFHLAPRIVTAHPVPRALQKRDTRTCGYVDGNSRSAYVCADPDAQCLFNEEASAVGCCWTTSCNIYTACLPYASSNARSTLDMDRTRYCSNSNSPSCATLVYADPTNSLSGYTIPSCDTVATTYKFYFSSFGANSPTTTRSSRSSSTTDESETSETSEPNTSSSTRDATGTRATATSTGDSQPVVASSSPPVGPIVGGVVGGVAALALIGLGIFFLIRRKNKEAASPPANPPAVPATGFGPPPGQGPYPNQTPPSNMAAMPGAFDPRYSIAKPTGATSVDPMQPASPMAISPSGSPPPVYHHQMQGMGNVPPAVGMGIGMGTPPPGQQMAMGTPSPPPMGMGTPPPAQGPNNGPYMAYHPGPHMQPAHGAVELPTQRGDGEVHELS